MISIILATYNRADTLKKTLTRLLNQRGGDFEIIVVDDGSTDHTEEMVKKLQTPRSKLPAPNYIFQKNAGQAVARNRGVTEARGEILIFIDDDIWVQSGWLKAHIDFHQKHPEKEAIAVGQITWSPEAKNNRFMRWLASTGLMPNYDGVKNGDQLDHRRFYTGNISLKRSWFDTHQFSEKFRAYGYEDSLLGHQLVQSGAKIYYNQKALVHHHSFFQVSDYLPFRMRQIGNSARIFNHHHPEFPVLPKGFKRLVFGLLSLPFVPWALGLFKKERKWYALSKRYFLQGMKGETTKTYLIAGSYGASNIGDEVMLEMILKHLPKASQKYVLSGGVSDTKKRHQKADKIASHLPFGVRSFLSFKWLKSFYLLQKSDVVLLGGGGLFVDDYSKKAVPLWAWHVFWFWIFQKPVILFANSVGPLKTKRGKKWTKWAIGKCQKIIVRDPLSEQLVKNLAPNTPVVLGVDLAFLHPPILESKKQKKLAINLRHWEMDFSPIAGLIKQKKEEGYEVVLMGMEKKDIDVLDALDLEGVEIIYPTDFKALCKHLSSCEVAVGMRLHFLIAAMLSGCKVAGISYSQKVEGILREFGLPWLAPKNCSPKKLHHLLKEARSVKGFEGVQKKAKAMFEQI